MFPNIYHLVSGAFHVCGAHRSGCDRFTDSTTSSYLNNAGLLSGGIQRLWVLKCYKPARPERFTYLPIKAMSRRDVETRFSKNAVPWNMIITTHFISVFFTHSALPTWCAVSGIQFYIPTLGILFKMFLEQTDAGWVSFPLKQLSLINKWL